MPHSSGNGHRTFFVSPDGDHFPGAVATIQHMVENKYSIGDIQLIVENHPESDLETAVEAAIEQLTNSGKYK